jgi:hypothetical protein
MEGSTQRAILWTTEARINSDVDTETTYHAVGEMKLRAMNLFPKFMLIVCALGTCGMGPARFSNFPRVHKADSNHSDTYEMGGQGVLVTGCKLRKTK